MPTEPLLYVNDLSLAAFGVVVNRPEGWGDGPPWQDQPVPVPGLAGGMLLSHETVVGTRTLTITGMLHAASATAARSQWDALKRHVMSPVSEVWFSTSPDRMARARYQSLVATRVRAPDRGIPFTLTLLMVNPHYLGRQVDVYTAAPTIPVRPTLGSAPSAPHFVIVGIGGTLPTVTYLDAHGTVRGVLTFDLGGLSLNAGEWIDYDGDTLSMTRHTVAGVVSNAAPLLQAESELFALDPQDGDGTAGPTLTATNCHVVLYLRKAWL